jgi:hypothetical protein
MLIKTFKTTIQRTWFLPAKNATPRDGKGRRPIAGLDTSTPLKTPTTGQTARVECVVNALAAETEKGGLVVTPLNEPAPNPCSSCPYRRDVPSGVWHEEEYVKLIAYDSDDQPMAVFMCHQTDRDNPKGRLCAGWVACHGGYELLALKIGVSFGRYDPSVLDYTTTVPLFESGTAAAEHGMREMADPSYEARVLIEKITASRPAVRKEMKRRSRSGKQKR